MLLLIGPRGVSWRHLLNDRMLSRSSCLQDNSTLGDFNDHNQRLRAQLNNICFILIIVVSAEAARPPITAFSTLITSYNNYFQSDAMVYSRVSSQSPKFGCLFFLKNYFVDQMTS